MNKLREISMSFLNINKHAQYQRYRFLTFLEGLYSVKTIIFLGCLLLIASAFANWLLVPIEGPVSGYTLQIFSRNEPTNMTGEMAVLSFGIFGAGLGILGLFTLFNRAPHVRLIIGVISIILALFFIYKFAFLDSAYIERAVDLNMQQSNINNFTKLNLPLNRGVEPLYSEDVSTKNFITRLQAILYFSTTCWGWQFAVIGGLLLIVSAFMEKKKSKISLNSQAAILVIPIIIFIIYLAYTMIMPEYHQRQGDNYLAQGLYKRAVENYVTALKHNPQLQFNEGFRHNLGAAFYHIGNKNKADYHLYKGDNLFEKERVFDALYEYKIAASMKINDYVIKKKLANLYINEGLLQFNKNNSPFAAIYYWKNALNIDNDQKQAHYFLAKAYFDVSQYEMAIHENIQFLNNSKNHLLNANIYSNIGDSYLKLKDFVTARRYYELSRKYDTYKNYRAGESLGGT